MKDLLGETVFPKYSINVVRGIELFRKMTRTPTKHNQIIELKKHGS